MDIVASNPKRYVAVDSSNVSNEVVKLTNTSNEFTGTFKIQDGGSTKDINNVFVKGIKVGSNGTVNKPVNGIVTIPETGGQTIVEEGIHGVSIVGIEDSRIDGRVVTTSSGDKIVEIPLEDLECDEVRVNTLLVGGHSLQELIPNLLSLRNLSTLPTSGTSLNDIIGALNNLTNALKTIANSQTILANPGA